MSGISQFKLTFYAPLIHKIADTTFIILPQYLKTMNFPKAHGDFKQHTYIKKNN